MRERGKMGVWGQSAEKRHEMWKTPESLLEVMFNNNKNVSIPVLSASFLFLNSLPSLLSMTDDNIPHPMSAPSTAVSRPKPSRSSTVGVVRGRTSPTPGASTEQGSDGRPPTKRARKAINCEPCRNSKLKCDRYFLSCRFEMQAVCSTQLFVLSPSSQKSTMFIVCAARQVSLNQLT